MINEILKNLYTRLYEIGKVMKIKDNDYIFLSLQHNTIYVIDSICIKTIDISNIEDLMILKSFNDFYQNFDSTIYLFKILKNIDKDNYHEIFLNNLFINNIGVIGYVDNVTLYEASNNIKRFKSIIMNMNSLLLNTDISLELRDLQNDLNFKHIMELKSSDGADKFIIDNNHIITLFNGLLPILKSDKINLYVRDIESLNYFNTIFEIRKKKYTINVIMNCLYI